MGRGVDQGAVVTITETVTAASLRPIEPLPTRKRKSAEVPTKAFLPLLGPLQTPARAYVVVGVGRRGRQGPNSKPASVPLVPPPPVPPTPAITYTEAAIKLAWTAAVSPTVPKPAVADVLPSRPLGLTVPTYAFNVYRVRSPSVTPDPAIPSIRLNASPLAEAAYVDPQIAWGAERCYTVRAVAALGSLSIESEAAAPACVTPKDTFPPAAPVNLVAVATDAAISLIWEPGPEHDIAGYLVLRAPVPGDNLQPVTPAPIKENTFRETVPAGSRYAYVVIAVDTAGNRSQPSNKVEETAR